MQNLSASIEAAIFFLYNLVTRWPFQDLLGTLKQSAARSYRGAVREIERQPKCDFGSTK